MALSNEDKKDVAGAFGKKAASAVSKATRDGFDGNKRWGNSGIRGVGANSPAMMEARKGFAKSKALKSKTSESKIMDLPEDLFGASSRKHYGIKNPDKYLKKNYN